MLFCPSICCAKTHNSSKWFIVIDYVLISSLTHMINYAEFTLDLYLLDWIRHSMWALEFDRISITAFVCYAMISSHGTKIGMVDGLWRTRCYAEQNIYYFQFYLFPRCMPSSVWVVQSIKLILLLEIIAVGRVRGTLVKMEKMLNEKRKIVNSIWMKGDA